MTQNKQVLDYMRDNGEITTMDAFQDLCITRLSARIFDLRNAGHKIVSESVTKNKKTFTKYHIEEEKNGKKRNL